MAKIVAVEFKAEMEIGNTGILVGMTKNEWSMLRSLCGVPYDKESFQVGTQLPIKKAQEAIEAFRNMQTVRKDMTKLQKTWATLMDAMDVVLAGDKKTDGQ